LGLLLYALGQTFLIIFVMYNVGLSRVMLCHDIARCGTPFVHVLPALRSPKVRAAHEKVRSWLQSSHLHTNIQLATGCPPDVGLHSTQRRSDPSGMRSLLQFALSLSSASETLRCANSQTAYLLLANSQIVMYRSCWCREQNFVWLQILAAGRIVGAVRPVAVLVSAIGAPL